MKEKFILILVGAITAMGAWAFWRYCGESGFSILSIVVIVSMTIDNVRLRKQLQHLKTEVKPSK